MKENLLPFSLQILFLPFEGYSINWFITYIYQSAFIFIAVVFMVTHFSFVLILTNHSCWGLDLLIAAVEELTQIPDQADLARQEITKQMKIIYEKSLVVIGWQRQAQQYLEFIFLVEFSLLSFMIGGCAYTIVTDPAGSTIVYPGVWFVLSQLFVYCFMGNRVNNRINELKSKLYDTNWYSMAYVHRMEIRLFLLMAQNLKNFNGLFKGLSMETFSDVCISI